MLPEWVTPAALITLCGIVWREVLQLRKTRHDDNGRIAKLIANYDALFVDMQEVKMMVGVIHESLLAAGIVKPRGGLIA